MTRTERENRITRTIETTKYEVTAVKMPEKEFKTFELTFIKSDAKTAEKAARQACKDSGLLFVDMTATKTEKHLYVATIEEYLKIAHIEDDSEE